MTESKEVLKTHTVTEKSWKDTTVPEPLPHQTHNLFKKKKKIKTLTPKDIYMHPHVHHSTTYKGQDMEVNNVNYVSTSG